MFYQTDKYLVINIFNSDRINFLRALVSLSLIAALSGCASKEEYSLDGSIPRLQTPIERIAYLCTKWKNDRHIQTVFYDKQDRVLEVFDFGSSSAKILNHYEGDILTKTVHYNHSSSSSLGYVEMDSLHSEFDANGRLVLRSYFTASLSNPGHFETKSLHKQYFTYTSTGDTLINGKVKNLADSSQITDSDITDINQWKWDEKKRNKNHYQLIVLNNFSPPDTISHFSQWFAYDENGRLNMSWFDNMYLGKYYHPAGPDTIWYQYNSRNQLVAEKHRYTIDMRNKRAFDSTGLSAEENRWIDLSRRRFFEGDQYIPNNDRIEWVKYNYEKFDPAKHQILAIPVKN